MVSDLGTLKAGVVSLVGTAENFIKDNLGTIGVGVGGVAVGSALGAITATTILKKGTTSSKSASRKKRSSARHTRNKRHKVRRYKYARTAGKRKDTSHKRIRMTKNGQPYVIMASGKARFIKRSSAHNSRKRKGGRY
jgi:Flp pilus assembly protein TadB